MTSTQHPFGSVIVESFPEEIVITDSFLRDADPKRVVVEMDRVRIYMDNGEATYMVSSRDEDRKTSGLTRLYSKMWSV